MPRHPQHSTHFRSSAIWRDVCGTTHPYACIAARWKARKVLTRLRVIVDPLFKQSLQFILKVWVTLYIRLHWCRYTVLVEAYTELIYHPVTMSQSFLCTCMRLLICTSTLSEVLLDFEHVLCHSGKLTLQIHIIRSLLGDLLHAYPILRIMAISL